MAWHAIDALSATAVADAQAADARRRGRKMRGPLDGVPVFAKAIYDMNGLPTTASNAEWARLFPDPVRRDALEVSRLRAAGAIVLGKTAADDFAYRGEGTSSHTGQVRNPYDPTGTRTPGGSSAGSAVAVASGMAFAALGTDDGGSNRIPARLHRRGRDEADVRAGAAHRRHPDLAVSRHARSARAFGGGRGAAARRHCRRRPVGSALGRTRAGRHAAPRFATMR